jgi:hypothetical protein
VWLLFVGEALADVPNIDICDQPPRDLCANDGSVCPKASPECGQLLEADGWTRHCTSWSGDEVWCAPPASSSLCATVAFGSPLTGFALLALGFARRRE